MILAIDTATAACSAALIEGDGVPLAVSETVGRGHAERLVPMVEALLRDAGGVVPDAILVDCGPGSFTGVRVGLAAAIGMGMGWGVPVRGCSSMALVAAACFASDPGLEACAVALNGGHGELFVQRFATHPFAMTSDLVSLPPSEAARFASEDVVAGSGASALVEARGTGTAIDALPNAASASLLPPAFATLQPRPLYGRPPDAKPKAA
ncbi:tRNA (adenosine(37)-N6)-threonylcarbamoyltransferase complex dimerization subunit type 1 TsaB [Sphingomonas sp. CGMCC 1.13654]|uniref:tRNA (Adenosine(37)-N6)-threonylcarbamoyltransferase complex dimerization subunit type 1 TsaB n=1 Tax=Sphingomonas chungangi TaxID=2683589 RepID=A0A838L7D3_9SPHN|nr:tRNA (adenosine(37)-N6)-threonylcarbamoyltransferase complex dimerization subunit type 1 TsaB [Sphingomonas chungangi]MBA2935064.1 tRNA (adenosine(37)-N6)-threonylcarbamoyltransferase complex dimerization subunit type 1 TsaB [Sphingomonas chungangi]MVW54180.1 tRNA (adenosine(37)-N6)-threonylcarbamoyltransferase complex dimerization subunit type 1 TsaB [Sphingomonas chungangi]